MKKTSSLSMLLLLTACITQGQIRLSVTGRHEKSDADLTFLYVTRDVSSAGSMLVARNESTGQNFDVSWGYLKSVVFTPKDIDQFWQAEGLKSKLYEDLFRNGFQYDRRRAMEEEMTEYLGKAEESGIFYIDSYLESKLYALLRKVYPVQPSEGRPGIMSLRILSDIVPDSWVGPDGTLIITTGMITAVNTEEELLGLMAQEVAHFALDHYIQNYNSIAVNGGEPSLASVIRYTLPQETEADECAARLMKMLGEDPLAISSMLRKVKAYGLTMGNFILTSSTGLFPGAEGRSAAIGMPGTFFSGDYERVISPLLLHNAYKAYYKAQYPLCQFLLNRNISSGEATVNDFILMSEAMLRLYDTPEKNEEALEMVRRAMIPGETAPAAAYKQEALVLLRMGRDAEAAAALGRCANVLDEEYKRYSAMPGDQSGTINYLSSEMELVGRMRRMMR